MPENESTNDVTSSWIPPGCRRILVRIGTLFSIGYIALFIFALVKVTWDMYPTFFTSVAGLVSVICGISALILITILAWIGWSWLQAWQIQRYTRPLDRFVAADNLQAAHDFYRARRDSPEKFTVLAQISDSQKDLPAKEHYLRSGLKHLRSAKAATNAIQPSVSNGYAMRCT